MKELTYNRLVNKSFEDEYEIFKNSYSKLFLTDEFDDNDINKLLSAAIVFSNQTDEVLKKLGYRIVLSYGLKTGDYEPLYDMSVNTGLIPITALLNDIEELPFGDGSNSEILSSFVESYIDNFRSGSIVRTEQQAILELHSEKNLENSTAIVAPTSYGKSELVISTIKDSANKRICVVVPSKALIAQTRKRILDESIEWVDRIVSHPEMHRDEDNSSVYVLTQERATRLLNNNKQLYFDVVIIDEAHNILSDDSRSTLLASVVKILKHRKTNTAFKFLTPFLEDFDSLLFRDDRLETVDFRVDEYVKSELLYISDYRDGKEETLFYDHFINQFVALENTSESYIKYLTDNSVDKNIVYFNRPKHIQIFSKQLADSLPRIKSGLIEDCISEISDHTHEMYLLLQCMQHGVLYHHGSMSDGIRNFVEYIYRNCSEIKYLVTSSTLLEGVNLPVERLFLFDTRKGLGNLKPAQFKNLIGRVNRFSDIFKTSNLSSLEKLQPEIHIIGTDSFIRKDSNIKKFIQSSMQINRKSKDKVENVLLNNAKLHEGNKNEYDRLLTRLKNLEEDMIKDDKPIAKTLIGSKLIESNVYEINIFECEEAIQEKIENFKEEHGEINDSNSLLSAIYTIFIAFIDKNNTNYRNGLTRLESDKAQTFYAMFLDWSIESTPMGVMIGRFIKYWGSLPTTTPVFIGSWGDVAKEGGHRELFTYISNKTEEEKINLAIVRIKEEEDFFDHYIFRFVEILNEIGLINDDFYKLSKYGTTNDETISLIQNGFSKGVSELIIKSYQDYIEYNNDVILISPLIHKKLLEDGVGFLQRHEVELNVKSV